MTPNAVKCQPVFTLNGAQCPRFGVTTHPERPSKKKKEKALAARSARAGTSRPVPLVRECSAKADRSRGDFLTTPSKNARWGNYRRPRQTITNNRGEC